MSTKSKKRAQPRPRDRPVPGSGRSTRKDAPRYITPTGLRGKRYWTDRMIRDYLGEPDKVAPNPHYRNGAPMRLYRLDRVEAIEATLDTDAMRVDRERRSAAAKSGAATRKENVPTRAAACDLECDFGDPLEEVRLAGAVANEEIREYHREEYEAYVGRCRRRGEKPSPRRGPRHPGVAAADRWAVNCLRHERTAYDRLRYELGDAARRILRRRVHGEISRAYPELRAAATRLV